MYLVVKNKDFVSLEHYLKKPKILILDDSTSAVDTKQMLQLEQLKMT